MIQLLNGMLEQGKKEKHEEQVQYAAYKQFCEDTEVEKTNAIKEAEEKIEMLKADIQKYEADAEARSKDIVTHDEDISNSHQLENFDPYQKMQRFPPFTRGCRMLAAIPVPLQGGCRRPQTTLSPFLCERPVSSAGFPHYRTGRRDFQKKHSQKAPRPRRI